MSKVRFLFPLVDNETEKWSVFEIKKDIYENQFF